MIPHKRYHGGQAYAVHRFKPLHGGHGRGGKEGKLSNTEMTLQDYIDQYEAEGKEIVIEDGKATGRPDGEKMRRGGQGGI